MISLRDKDKIKQLFNVRPTFVVAVDDAVARAVTEVVLGVAGSVVKRDQVEYRKFWQKIEIDRIKFFLKRSNP